MPDPKRPGPARPGAGPGSIYRLQLQPGFGFAEAAAQASYLSELGITHAYLSSILQAAPGSRHGYDVTDHSRISADLGGEDDFRHLAASFAAYGIGVVADVVPNHMGIPAPEYLNRPLWSVLSEGPSSARAHWFDIDWTRHDGRMLLPILARPLPYCLDELQVASLAEVAGPEAVEEFSPAGEDLPVLRYQGHVLPVRPGTQRLPIADLVAALGAKLVQLTMPGVPDVYQGCELSGLSLVAPDNRQPADFDRRRVLLAAADEGMLGAPAGLSLDAAKLLVTSRALRLRRDHPDWFAGSYQPLAASGPAAEHAVAFGRAGQAMTVATRLPAGLRRAGGWRDTALAVPPGRWRDLLTGAQHESHRSGGDPGQILLADLTAGLPVALLVQDTEFSQAGAARTTAPA